MLTAFLRGYLRVEIRGAGPESFLNRCAEAGIPFWNSEPVDAYTLRLRLHWKNRKRAVRIAARCGCELRVLGRRGLPLYAARSKGRAALLAGLVLVPVLLGVSSLFVWDIQVQDCPGVSEARVRNVLADCGVREGAFWPAFQQDLIRSRVLLEIPELHWMTVNSFGSRARVLLRPRVEQPDIVDENAPTALVAEKDGLIERMGIRAGYAVTAPGKAVLAGEELVSAAVPGFSPKLRLVHAGGEVYARTWYEKRAVMPLSATERRTAGKTERRFSILLGQKVINIFQKTGQSGGEYDKIIKESYLEIPGLFRFPIGLRQTQLQTWETAETSRSREEVWNALEQQLLSQLEEEIGETGQVLQKHFVTTERNGLAEVRLLAECREQIAAERPLSPEECRNLLEQAEQTPEPEQPAQ